MALVLSADDVRQCLDMSRAIAAIESMCEAQAAGTALLADRVSLPLPNGWIRLMPGALVASGVVGYKEFHLTRVPDASPQIAHVRYAYHLFDYSSGELIAMMDADYLTFIRTAAASAAAIKRLARAESAVLGIIGSGAEARSHVEAAAAVRPVKRAKVFSRDPARRQRFASEMSARMKMDIVAVDHPEKAVAEADILVVATNTSGTGPALTGAALHAAARSGLHINSIGSTLPTQREIDPGVWSFADRIVVDSRRLLSEGGDGIAATQAAAYDPAQVAELHEVISGRCPGRSTADEATLYKSIGTGLQDVAVAFLVYQQALIKGLGRRLEGFQSVKTVEPN